MPHSNHDSAGSSDTFDLTGPMTSTAHYLNDAGVGRAISPNNQTPHQPSSLQSNAWKRRSLPNTGVYAEYIDRSDLDELLALRAARNNRNPQASDPNQSAGRRSSHHEDQQLHYRDSAMAIARERAQRESPVIAELRTNVIVKDEFTLVTDLSHHLAQRYARSGSAIMVKVDHSACIALGGTFDPCYIMTVTNIPSQMGPAMNRRNAALIQSFMSDILSVPPDRGIVQFHAIAEQDLATNGTTVQGEIERQEKQQLENGGPATRRYSNGNGIVRKPQPQSSLRRTTPKLDTSTNRSSSLYPSDNPSYTSLNHRTSSTSLSPTVTITPANAFDQTPTIPESSPPRLSSPGGKGENSLRMHPVTPADLPTFNSPSTSQRLPNGRPKTISAEIPSSYPPEPERLTSLPKRQSFSSPSHPRPSQPLSFLKSDPSSRPLARPSSTLPPGTSQSAPGSRHGNGSGNTGSYYGTSLDPKPGSRRGGDGKGKSGGGSRDGDWGREGSGGTANTARRRSTITATPRLPGPSMSAAAEAAVGTEGPATVASSARSVKMSKRKSFFAAFKRGPAAV